MCFAGVVEVSLDLRAASRIVCRLRSSMTSSYSSTSTCSLTNGLQIEEFSNLIARNRTGFWTQAYQ